MLSKFASPAWATLEYVWYPALIFLATPYFLHTLGPDKYGHWMLLTAIAGFGAILNMGTGAATIKQVSTGRGRSGAHHVEAAIRSSLAIALLFGGLIATLIFTAFSCAGEALFPKMGEQPLIRLTGVVAAMLAWIEQIDNVCSSALKGGEEFGSAAKLEIGSKTVQIIIVMMAVMIWGSIEAVYTALLLVAAARLTAKFWMVRQFLPLSSLRPTFAHVKDIINDAKWGWVQGIGALLFGIADRMLVGSFLGAASLAHYSVATQLAQQVHALPAAGFSVLFPKVSRKVAESPNFAIGRIGTLTMIGNFIASSILALFFLIFGKTLLSIWVGAVEAHATEQTLWYLVIAYWLLAMNVVPHFIFLGLGKMRFLAISNVSAGVISLAAMLVLLQSYELIGVATARIVYGGVTVVNCFWLVEYLRSDRRQSAKETISKPLVDVA